MMANKDSNGLAEALASVPHGVYSVCVQELRVALGLSATNHGHWHRLRTGRGRLTAKQRAAAAVVLARYGVELH